MSVPTVHRALGALVSGSSQPPASGAAAPKPFDNLRLVFNGDILLIAFFACFVVVSLPRAFARMLSGWRGHILWSVAGKRRDRKLTSTPSSTEASTENYGPTKSEDSHTYQSHARLVRRESDNVLSAIPYHIPTLSSIFHPIAPIFRYRIIPGFSLGQAVILGVYGGVLIYVLLYQSNTFTDPSRAGFVGMSQIPLVFAFATKNNLLGMLVGLGYEKVWRSLSHG